MKKISFIRTCDMEEIKATDCIVKVLITSGNIKWRSFALRFCASNHKSAWQPLLPSANGLSFIFTFYPYTRVMVIFTFPFYTLSFGKHYVLERSWYIYTSKRARALQLERKHKYTLLTQQPSPRTTIGPSPLFLRGIIFVLPLILLLTLAGDGLGVHTKQKNVFEYV